MNKPFIEATPPREHVDLIADLGAADAEELQVKFDLSRRIAIEIEDREFSQAKVAEMTGLKQPDISRIVNGIVKDYSVWRLMRVLSAMGQNIAIEVYPSGDDLGSIYTVDEQPEADMEEEPAPAAAAGMR